MTTETEKKFFKAFGIGEPSEIDLLKPEYANQSVYKKCEKNKYCDDYCDEAYEAYPEITDRILLELICILTKVHPEMSCGCFIFTCENIEQLKELALEDCLEYSEHIYIAVRKLFGVEEE